MPRVGPLDPPAAAGLAAPPVVVEQPPESSQGTPREDADERRRERRRKRKERKARKKREEGFDAGEGAAAVAETNDAGLLAPPRRDSPESSSAGSDASALMQLKSYNAQDEEVTEALRRASTGEEPAPKPHSPPADAAAGAAEAESSRQAAGRADAGRRPSDKRLISPSSAENPVMLRVPGASRSRSPPQPLNRQSSASSSRSPKGVNPMYLQKRKALVEHIQSISLPASTPTSSASRVPKREVPERLLAVQRLSKRSESVELHPLKLTFVGMWSDLEQEFENFYYKHSLQQIRAAIIIVIMFYFLPGLFELASDDEGATAVLLVRILVCLIGLLFAWVLYVHPEMIEDRLQLFLSFAGTFAGIGLIGIVVIGRQLSDLGTDNEANDGIVSVFAFLICVFLIIKLRFVYAVTTALVHVTLYLIAVEVFDLLDVPPDEEPTRDKSTRWLLVLFHLVCILFFLSAATHLRERSIRRDFVLHELLHQERQKSDLLLRKMLPEGFANDLKDLRAQASDDGDGGFVPVDRFCVTTYHPNVAILFCMIHNFESLSIEFSANQVVGLLNDLWTSFDRLIDRHRVQKLETNGPVYMAATGLGDRTDCDSLAQLAIDMQRFVNRLNIKPMIRIGMHVGEVEAGVVGKKAIRYSLFGDAVNTTARVQSLARPRTIRVTSEMRNRLVPHFEFGPPELVNAKGKGQIEICELLQPQTVSTPSESRNASRQRTMNVRDANWETTRTVATTRRFTLRFDADKVIEKRFVEHYIRTALRDFRVAVLFSILSFSGYSFLDEDQDNVFVLRVLRYTFLMMLIVCFALTLLLSEAVWRRIFFTVSSTMFLCGQWVVGFYAYFATDGDDLYRSTAKLAIIVFFTLTSTFSGLLFRHTLPVLFVTWLSYNTLALVGGASATDFFVENFFLVFGLLVNLNASYWREDYLRKSFLLQVAMTREMNRSDEILCDMLPEFVVLRLHKRLDGETATFVEHYAMTTVISLDIEGYTAVCARISPKEVALLLNDVYCVFDDLCAEYGVLKIESEGDALTAVAGVPEALSYHAEVVVNLAVQFTLTCQSLHRLVSKGLRFRIGVHSGPVLAGIIGSKVPRYHVWGPTVTRTQKLEQNGLAGRVHVSETTYLMIRDRFQFEPWEMKVQGSIVPTYLMAVNPRALGNAQVRSDSSVQVASAGASGGGGGASDSMAQLASSGAGAATPSGSQGEPKSLTPVLASSASNRRRSSLARLHDSVPLPSPAVQQLASGSDSLVPAAGGKRSIDDESYWKS